MSMHVGVSTGFKGRDQNKTRYVRCPVSSLDHDKPGYRWLYDLEVTPKHGSVSFDLSWRQSFLEENAAYYCPADRVYAISLAAYCRKPGEARLSYNYTASADEEHSETHPHGVPHTRRMSDVLVAPQPSADWGALVELVRRAPHHDVGLMILGWIEDNLPDPWARLATPDAREFFQSLVPLPLWEKL